MADRPPSPRRRVLAAPDKFRGTATASDIAAAVGRAAAATGWDADEAPAADGGEGTLEALGGAPRREWVRGPLGDAVEAEWRMRSDRTAVVEMARASGLDLVGGAAGNDPLRASTFGTGQLIAAALHDGARRVIVGAGGSATTDGGLGAVTALTQGRRVPASTQLMVACDVTTFFLDAAEVFAPQKGATGAQVSLLRRRLERLADVYLRDYGIDVRDIPGSGAAGGLGGGLAALGAELTGGFDVVADALGLEERVEGADLVVTGEGHLDAESFEGKVVGGVLGLAARAGVPVLVVTGAVDADDLGAGLLPGLEPAASGHRSSSAGLTVVSLVDRFGPDRAESDPANCVEEVVRDHLEAAKAAM